MTTEEIQDLQNKKIKKFFSKSHDTYIEQSIVQQDMADKLINQLLFLHPEFINFDESLYISDLGTGTHASTINNLINRIKITDYSRLALVDLVEVNKNSKIYQNEEIGKKKVAIEVYQQDANQWMISQKGQPAKYDLIISNAMLQWIKDKQSFFNNAYDILSNNGIFAFTTFGIRNLIELRLLGFNSLDYIPSTIIKSMLLQAGFKIEYFTEWTSTIHLSTSLEVLKHFKYTGTNQFNNKIWTKKDLINFSRNYEKFKNKEGKFGITYNPVIFIVSI